MNNKNLRKGGKPGNRGGNKNSGRNPDWLKEKCRNIVEKSKLIDLLTDVADGKEIETSTVYDMQGNAIGTKKSAAATKDRLRALEMLLDRGWGKPTQEVSADEGLKNILTTVIVRASQSNDNNSKQS